MTAELDLIAVQTWFERLYGEIPETDFLNICRTDNWTGKFFPVRDAMDHVATVLDFDAMEPAGIYHRVTSMREVPPVDTNGKRGRGDTSLSHHLPGFFADIDIAGPGHKSKGELPPDRKAAIRIVNNSCLPDPTLWVDSGGGLYPWWLFDKPFEIVEDNIEALTRLSDDLQGELQRSARELGMEYAPLGDLARVLRVPGTINRKVPGKPTECKIIRDMEYTYKVKDLRDLVPATTRRTVTPSAKNRDLQRVLDELEDGPPCRAMVRKIVEGEKALRTVETGGRHAKALSVIGSILWMGNVGHAGAREGLDTLKEVFEEIKPEAEDHEWPALVGYVLERMEIIDDRHCCGEMTFSDGHLSLNLVKEELRGLYLWSVGTGWLRWTGKIWKPCTDAAMAKVAQTWLINNFKDATDNLRFSASKSADEEVKGWRAAMSTSRINGLISLARGHLEFEPGEMDADPDILVTPNGVVDLRTGEIHEHDAKRLVSKITYAEYDPQAESEDFLRILSAVPEYALPWFQVKIGQAATGYPLIGDNPNVIAKGGGMNGKTTTFNCLAAALGTYAVKVPKEVLTGERAQHEIMTLWGARFALTEELPEGARLNTVQLKELTDTEEIQGRYLFKNLVTWRPTHSLFVTTNPLPQVAETTLAVWRRLSLLIFPYVYVSEDEDRPLEPHERWADPGLRMRARDRDPEIMKAALRWIIDGAKEFYAAGMTVPQPPREVLDDTRAWRRESDVILSFWDDGLVVGDEAGIVTSEDLHTAFVEWTVARGNKPISTKVFNPMFGEHQETKARNVFRDRPKQLPLGVKLSRPDGAMTPVPARPTVWTGMRFASDTVSDDPFGGDPFGLMDTDVSSV
jgi:P4 family phage/plasmid primase-like protien